MFVEQMSELCRDLQFLKDFHPDAVCILPKSLGALRDSERLDDFSGVTQQIHSVKQHASALPWAPGQLQSSLRSEPFKAGSEHIFLTLVD